MSAELVESLNRQVTDKHGCVINDYVVGNVLSKEFSMYESNKKGEGANPLPSLLHQTWEFELSSASCNKLLQAAPN